jgi:hypothetical protein
VSLVVCNRGSDRGLRHCRKNFLKTIQELADLPAIDNERRQKAQREVVSAVDYEAALQRFRD